MQKAFRILPGPAREPAITATYPLLRTLLVGSDFRFCSQVGAYLGSHSRYDVVGVAHSGWHALQLAGELDPMLVIADFLIGDMTGAAVARALKAHAHPPIVLVLAGEPSQAWMDISLKAGADDYLYQSDIERLPEVLHRIELGQRRH